MIGTDAPVRLEPGAAPGGYVLHVYARAPGARARLLMVEQILAGDEPRGATDAETAVAALRPGEELVALFYDGDSGELAGLYRLPSLEDHRWSR